MISALVPVKALSASKSRLFPGIERESIERLSLSMMADVVDALGRVGALARVAVVTPDESVARAAEALGAMPLLRADPGLNPAIDNAARELADTSEDGVLVVLGDVPAAEPTDLEQLLESLEGPGVALAPSSDGGTSALLRRPYDAIAARFGSDSAKRHRDAAQRSGVVYHELPLPSLAIDLDVFEDAEELLLSKSLGWRTRAALEEIRACRTE